MKNLQRGHAAYLLLCLAIVSTSCTAQSAAIVVSPGDDVAAIVRGASPGTTFVFSPGIYRNQSIVPKDNDSFVGKGAAVLDGAIVLAMRQQGDVWSASAPVSTTDPKNCRSDHPFCYILSDLFLDNQLQSPVGDRASLRPGTWFYDFSAQTVYIGSNPLGHIVELGASAAAFSGAGSGVNISNLVVEKYASPPQRGAIGAGGVRFVPAHWTVTRVEVRWNHGAGIHLGANGRIEQCNVHHNGQLGLGAGGPGVLVENNEISFSNYAGFRAEWEAGATKFSKTDGLVLRNNFVHDNDGNGLWTDIDNKNVLMEGNTITNNTEEGIRHEISYDAIIRRNILRGNKSGIVIAQSANVDVYENTISVPVNGEFGIRLDVGHRLSDANVPYTMVNVQVHNNTISYLGAAGRSGLVGQVPSGSNVTFDRNEYHLGPAGDKGRWRWNNQSLSLAGIQQMGMEVHATAHQ